jgi:diguanylate cyclase (GGDEF)-like protein/PAS domain S-box-containing protein
MSRDFSPSSDAAGPPVATDAQARRIADLVFDQTPLGMVLMDTAGTILRINRACAQIVGRHVDDLVGSDMSAVVHENDRPAVVSQLKALVSGDIDQLRADTRLVHGDGRVVWVGVHAACVREIDGSPQCVITQIEDITERRQAVATVAQAEERFRTTFERAPIGMILTDVHGVLLRVNPAYCAIVGRDADALVGANVNIVTHPDDVDDTSAQVEALTKGEIDSFSMEKRYVHGDGAVVWVAVSASCVRDDSGAPLFLVGQVEDITERRAMRERLTHAAIHDSLTDLPNRDLFIDRLEMALRRSQRSGRRVAVMFLDLDRFKMVNDSLGHEVGDRLLRAVADRMSSALRSSDTLARFGGDEFTILCDEVTDEAHALEIADRIRSTMRKPLTVTGAETFVSFSLGIALSTDAEESGSTLLRQADMAMYKAKEHGAAHVEVFRPDSSPTSRSRLRTSTDLHGALERHELDIYYQPLVDLHTQTMVGLEALVRWRHPTRGVLMPDEFLSLAEDNGLVGPFGAWALGQTCRQAVDWNARRQAAGLQESRLNVAVTVAAGQLADARFPDLVADILADTGVNPERLWLEFTETALMRDAESSVKALHALRDLGLRLAIADFGTGYSSLAYLRQFPVEVLKIDRSFVREVDRRVEDTTVVKAIVGVGESLAMLIVADGVERWEQVGQLQSMGCHLAQGYLFGHPLRAQEIGPYPGDDLGIWQGLLEATTI